MNLEKWKRFFQDSGIPASEASTYAFKFYQNRIRTNMLVDLNKDYLKEMGITIMGDVIAILRHARQFYEDIQKTGKSELLEETKDKRKEKEIPTKPSKKLPTDTAPVKTETSASSKSTSRSTMKRKSELAAPAKKAAVEPAKKPKLPVTDDNIEECEDLGYVMIDPSKKALLFSQKMTSGVETQLKNLPIEKQEKADMNSDFFNMSEDDDDDDDNVEVIINDPIVTPFSGYKKFPVQDSSFPRFKEYPKSVSGQDTSKRTVFKRLGDDISQHAVSSTTAFEDEQFSFISKKTKEDTAKLTQEKNSVFHRLGQKCDVSSTSVDSEKYAVEDTKSVVKSDSRDRDSVKSNPVLVPTSEVTLSRRVKVQKDIEDSDSCLPLCVKSTFSEGILANSGNAKKLTLKERLGLSKGTVRTNTRLLSDSDYSTELRLRKYTSNDSYQREKLLSSSKKRVSFGSVSQKLIPSREEAIRNGELSMASERTSVFDRLGFNRTY